MTTTQATRKALETANLASARAAALNANRKLAEARRHFENAIAELAR